MHKILLTWLLILLCTASFAQLTPEQRIQDSVIGWWEKLSIPAVKQYPGDGITFLPKQQENMNAVIGWMQKSYTPVGGIGTYTRKWYKDKAAFSPHQYGVDFRVWNVSYRKEYLDEKGHFKPVSEEYTRFDVNANVIPGSYPIYLINTVDQYLFTWPPDGYKHSEDNQKSQDKYNPKINPNVNKFLTWINEYHTVFLVPENKLPIIAVTKGEYLQLAEAAMDRALQNEKERIYRQWSDKKSRDDAYKYSKDNIDRYIKAIQQLKEKYTTTLNEPAVLRNMQPAYNSIDGSIDPFEIKPMEKSQKNYFPVYKIEPAVLEKCKSNQPQWIAVSFPYKTKEDGNQLYEMYRSITENFNYDYAYDYFFNPEKVKGRPYKPSNEEQLNARLEGYRKKTTFKKTTSTTPVNLQKNIFFTDDFSENADGDKPKGWYFTTYGKHATITTIKNMSGKWVQLGYNNPVSATSMKKPLPENFTLEYDVVTADFSSRTGGAVKLYLSSYPLRPDGLEDLNANGTTLSVNIISGNHTDYENNSNYAGSAKIDLHMKPSVNNENYVEGILYNYPLKEFTNTKNIVHVAVKIKSGELTLFVNGKEVAVSANFKMAYGKPCISCNLPAGTKFNTVYWKNTTNDADHINVYISNIKITKE